MSLELSSEYFHYLQLSGHRVIQTSSTLWIDVRPGVFQTAPPFPFNQIQSDEVNGVFESRNVLACRWFSMNDDVTTSNSSAEGTTLYAARPHYDLSSLDPKARNKTRRGLERVEVRRVGLDDRTEPLAYDVYADNVRRLGLFKTEKRIEKRWKTWANTIRKASCVEFWSAWQDKSLVAFTLTARTALGTELVMQRSSHSALDLHPNNALIYTVTKDAFERGSPLVSFGLSAFHGDKGGLHRFKIGMGFRAFPLRQHHQWHPWVRPLGPLLNPHRLRNAYLRLSRILPG
jgi:hypothetical protein